jgi:hypothetical protein
MKLEAESSKLKGKDGVPSGFDEFVKSRKAPFFVIPAEAGIQSN